MSGFIKLSMDVTGAIKKRRSIKKYHDLPVSWEKIGSILDAGRLAPSAGNLQPWKFIVVMDEGKRKKISEACFQQYWMQSAPVHIIICAEMNKMSRFYGIRGERLYITQSCAMAAENMIIEATNQELGSCFVSAFEEEIIRYSVGIPEFARPQGIITIGVPAEEVPEPPKYTLNDVVFVESFGAKIRDFEGYIGYHWGRNVQRVVEFGRDMINDAADKGIKGIKNAVAKSKEKSEQDKFKSPVPHKHHDYKDDSGKDFRYQLRK